MKSNTQLLNVAGIGDVEVATAKYGDWLELTARGAKVLREAGLARGALAGCPWHGRLYRFTARPRKGWPVEFGHKTQITGDGHRRWTSHYASGYSETFYEPSTLGVTLKLKK